MIAERKAFEAWWKSIHRQPKDDIHSAWSGWQASRKVALEDAAKVCLVVALPGVNEYADGYNTGAFECERRIKEILK